MRLFSSLTRHAGEDTENYTSGALGFGMQGAGLAPALARLSFCWLAEEPDLYDDTCGEAIYHAAAEIGS